MFKIRFNPLFQASARSTLGGQICGLAVGKFRPPPLYGSVPTSRKIGSKVRKPTVEVNLYTEVKIP